ncbi:MAG: acetylxylan esterase, partial [Kribbellaceae bacterium]|nr:acetylxylan esterase [Kribbellaceae bacterium]
MRDPENATVEVDLPEDFDDFWAAGLADCASYPLDPALSEMPALSTDRVSVYDLRFTRYGGLR